MLSAFKYVSFCHNSIYKVYLTYWRFFFEFSVLSSLALTMDKEYNEGRWFEGQGEVDRDYDILP